MLDSTTPDLYALHPAVLLHWAGWDDEYVVYDEASGQTFHFDALRGFVLNALSERSHTRDSIIAQLAAIGDLAQSPDLAGLISNALRELATLGLLKAQAP